MLNTKLVKLINNINLSFPKNLFTTQNSYNVDIIIILIL